MNTLHKNMWLMVMISTKYEYVKMLSILFFCDWETWSYLWFVIGFLFFFFLQSIDFKMKIHKYFIFKMVQLYSVFLTISNFTLQIKLLNSYLLICTYTHGYYKCFCEFRLRSWKSTFVFPHWIVKKILIYFSVCNK